MLRWITAGLLVLAAVVAAWLASGPDEPPLQRPEPALRAAVPARGEPAQAPPVVIVTAAEATRVPEPLVAAEAAAANGSRAERLLDSGEPLAASGRVTDSEGAPVAGADVWFLPPGRLLEAAGYPTTMDIPFIGLGMPSPTMVAGVPLEDLPHAVTDALGAFALVGPDDGGTMGGDPFPAPAVPQLIVRKDGYAVRVHSLRGGGKRNASALELPLGRALGVEGRVVDSDGAGLAGVAVRLVSNFGAAEGKQRRYFPQASIGALHATVTEPDGSFRMGDLWAGTVKLEFVAGGHVRESPAAATLSGESFTRLADVVLRGGGVIEGRVRDVAGQPVQGAAVFAVAREVQYSGRGCVMQSLGPDDDALPLELEAEWWPDTCTANTDADGHYRIQGLEAPTVTLYARASGFEAARLRDVAEGERAAWLTLQPEACLDVAVVEARTGRSIESAEVSGRRVIGEGHGDAPLRVERRGHGFRLHGVGRLGSRVLVSASGFSDREARQPGTEPGAVSHVTVELERDHR
jgi:hypothetical protein